MAASPPPSEAIVHRNEIHLIGVVRAEPEVRTLPSGDEIVALRIGVDRSSRERRTDRSPRSDLFDVTCFTAATRRTARSLTEGDLVELDGAMRRSVRRGPSGVTSRMDLEVQSLSRRSARRRAG